MDPQFAEWEKPRGSNAIYFVPSGPMILVINTKSMRKMGFKINIPVGGKFFFSFQGCHKPERTAKWVNPSHLELQLEPENGIVVTIATIGPKNYNILSRRHTLFLNDWFEFTLQHQKYMDRLSAFVEKNIFDDVGNHNEKIQGDAAAERNIRGDDADKKDLITEVGIEHEHKRRETFPEKGQSVAERLIEQRLTQIHRGRSPDFHEEESLQRREPSPPRRPFERRSEKRIPEGRPEVRDHTPESYPEKTRRNSTQLRAHTPERRKRTLPDRRGGSSRECRRSERALQQHQERGTALRRRDYTPESPHSNRFSERCGPSPLRVPERRRPSPRSPERRGPSSSRSPERHDYSPLGRCVPRPDEKTWRPPVKVHRSPQPLPVPVPVPAPIDPSPKNTRGFRNTMVEVPSHNPTGANSEPFVLRHGFENRGLEPEAEVKNAPVKHRNTDREESENKKPIDDTWMHPSRRSVLKKD